MNNMVTNITSTVPSQSSSTPVKKATTEVVTETQQGGNQAANTESSRQPAASESVTEKVEQRLDDVVERLNDFVQQSQRDLNFKVDKQSGRTVVTVTDTVTEEVIRQIPSKEALERLQNLEDIQGLLFRDQA